MPNGALAISLRDGDKTPSQLAFAAVLQPPHCFPAFFSLSALRLLCFFLVLGYFLVWPYCPYVVCIAVTVLTVLSLRGTPWFPYRRYAGNSIKQHNKVSPPLGHWNPETLEPRVEAPGHCNPKCTGRRKGTDPRTGNGHRPEERFSFFRYPPWQSLAVAFHCHGGYDVLGGARWLQVQFFGVFFPRL